MNPLAAPYFFTASIMYWLHEGSKRQQPRNIGLSVHW